MSTAADIKALLDAGTWRAYTFSGGYAIDYDGKRKLFEPGIVVKEKRFETGRLLSAETVYQDGSTLIYGCLNGRVSLTVKE